MIKGIEKQSFRERLKEINKGWGEEMKEREGLFRREERISRGDQAKSSKGKCKTNLSVKVS